MAYATKKYTADNVTTDTIFTTPNYISGRAQDISVFVDDILKTKDTHYSLVGTQVKFLTGQLPANNNIIKIVRSSNQSSRLTDYQDGSSLNADTLDADANQLFFVAQEALDTASETNLNASTFYTSGTSAPTTPDIGDLWYDTNAGVNKIKVYSGSAWVDAFPVVSRTLYNLSDEVASTADKTANKLVYTVGSTNVNSVHVYLNGVKLKEGSSDDYVLDSTAGNSTTYGSNNVIKINNLWDSSGNTYASGFAGTDDIEILAFTATEENEAILKYSGVTKAEATSTGIDVTGTVNVNGDSLEITSSDTGATAMPVLSLYKDSTSPAVNDIVGAVRFFGNNTGADNKKSMGGIECTYTGSNTTGNSAFEETAKLSFNLPRGDGAIDSTASDNPVTSITGDITADHSFMELTEESLTLKTQKGLKFSPHVTDGIVFQIVKDGGGYFDIVNHNTSNTGQVYLPDRAGTIIVGVRDSNGDVRLNESFVRDVELAPRTEVVSTAHNPANNSSLVMVKNRKYVNTYTASINTFILPTGTNTGQMLTVVNASDKDLYIDRTTNSITIKKLVAESDPTSITSGNLTIKKGGVVEFVYSANTEVQCFGSGI